MFVDDYVGLDVLALETRFDEVDLGLNRSQVVLCSTLQQETRADGREVGDLRNVQPDILGKHIAEAGHDLFGLPSLTLEVDDIALHEDGAAVSEGREAFRGESSVGVVFDGDIETLRRGLQEVAVAS